MAGDAWREGMPVEAAWVLTFHDLHPDAQQVMRACAVLDQPSIALATAAAVADLPLARIAATLAPAESAGWGGVTADRFALSYRAQTFLRDLARTMVPQDVQALLDAVAAELISTMTSETTGGTISGALGGAAMSAGVRADVLGVIQAANRHRHPRVAFRVARLAWQTLAPPPRTTPSPGTEPNSELEWGKRLADHGEQAAIALADREGLIGLLDLSARFYTARGYWRGAEAAWLGALSIVDDLRDVTRFVHFLRLLATNYRSWGLPHKTVDMLLEMVPVQERQGDHVALAETLADIGATFLDAGGDSGAEDAEEYLERALRLLRDDAPDTTDTRRRRAAVLGDLGRVHVQRGRINAARTFYHQALTIALDVGDDALVDRVRAFQEALRPS